MIILVILVIVGALYYAKKNNGNINLDNVTNKITNKSTKLYKLVDKRTNEIISIYMDKLSKYKIISVHYLLKEREDGLKVTVATFYESDDTEAIKRYACRMLDDICPAKYDVEHLDSYVKSDDGITMVMSSALIKRR